MRYGSALVLAAALVGCATRAGAPATPAKASLASREVDVRARPKDAGRVRASFLGAGMLEARGETSARTKLALERLSVVATTTGDQVETTVEHVFRNDRAERLEGTFRFPLPEGAILTGLAMEIHGELMEGELVSREKARKAYEQVVDQMLDPALLEWENGRTFKLRVFPIEPNATKRVVLRFVAPLHRTRRGLYFAYRPPTSGAGVAVQNVSVTLDGRELSGGERTETGELLVKVRDAAPALVVERTSRGAYLLAHVDPVFPEVEAAPKRGQALVVVCDRSRSMLEARALQAKTVSLLLGELEARDRFTVVTGDVEARAFGEGLHEPTARERAAAVAFVDREEPDGASDLGALLTAAGEATRDARAAGLEPVVVYVGDAAPTWGETRASGLEKIAEDALGGAPLHIIVLGKSPDDEAARALADAHHGRLLHPKSEGDAARAAAAVASARTTPRVEHVRILAADGVEIPLAPPGTIYEGDDASFAAFVPKARASAPLRISYRQGERSVTKNLSLASAVEARHVAKRWARARIERLQRDGGAHKDEIVETSLEHGVMSRYTSFLVLESEEAYARFKIARKAKSPAPGEPRVTGRDLESTDSRSASVTPDHLQPGDPEVRIHAPADAQSVVVVFPFGETKNATYERGPRGGSWVVRFLVDAHTPDGSYEIVARITHHDGRVEIVRLPYMVDTKSPAIDVAVRARGGAYEIRATQRLTREEIQAQAPEIAHDARRLASILTDAKRVEVHTPDGQTLSLTHVRLGHFVGTWRPKRPVSAGEELRLVVVDRALNERVVEVEVP